MITSLTDSPATNGSRSSTTSEAARSALGQFNSEKQWLLGSERRFMSADVAAMLLQLPQRSSKCNVLLGPSVCARKAGWAKIGRPRCSWERGDREPKGDLAARVSTFLSTVEAVLPLADAITA
jgi:hypothetical protein